MLNVLLFVCLGLVGLASWKLLKNYEKKEAELIAKYNKMKRENGLR